MWTGPAEDGGAGIDLDYQVFLHGKLTKPPSNAIAIMGSQYYPVYQGKLTTCKLTGLSKGTKYTARVQASNAAGPGGAVETSFSTPIDLRYFSDNDDNGVIYWIGTQGKQQTFVNPHISGLCRLTASCDFKWGNLEWLLEHNLIKKSPCGIQQEKGWITVDLGTNRSVLPTFYTLRHGNMGSVLFRLMHSTK